MRQTSGARKGEPLDGGVLRKYVPPFEEFQLETLSVTAGSQYTLSPSQGPSLLLVHKGAATASGDAIARGHVLFVPAGEAVSLDVTEPLSAFRASVNDSFFAV